jgi:hypothetical protein
MKSDTVICSEGLKVLSEHLGLLETERFIALISREPFDYTQWQRDLYAGMSVEELGAKAKAYWEATHE